MLYRAGQWEGEKKGTVVPSKVDHIHVSPGDVLEWITWGGGGLGDPLTRPAEKVALEVQRGLVTPQGAEVDYGVVLSKDGGFYTLDTSRTEALREKMREERDAQNSEKVSTIDERGYDRGGSLQRLVEGCKLETGLDPPTPVWESESAGYGPHVGRAYVKEWYEMMKGMGYGGWHV